MISTRNLSTRLRQRMDNWRSQRQIERLAAQVACHARPDPARKPVVLFNASARITNLSQNAAFSLLTGWALRLAGAPVIHFVSRSGMSHCVLGTNRQDFHTPPPCEACLAQSRRLYHGADVRWFEFQRDPGLEKALAGLSIEQLCAFEYPAQDHAGNPLADELMPLGKIVLPSIRWALRRHHLPDDEPTHYLLREYILSAYNVAQEFGALLAEVQPSCAIIFNGMMYPEAAARWVARQRGVRSLTHEVGFQKLSTFFSEGEATAYPTRLPEGYELSECQNARLDDYLEKRFQGQFTMAGIRFWPEMRGLDQDFLAQAARFKQVVPVFTNVVYDTSQAHANVIFPHMFAWLDLILEIIQAHPETLFVIRAHPDEMRPGTAKLSNESVHDWVIRNRVNERPNVVFIDSQEYISSYELIGRSKFVIVYNSSIGLEATLLGKAVLVGGKARYTQYPIVFFPPSPEALRQQAETFLAAEQVDAPGDFQRNARRFLYFQLFRASLPLEAYLQPASRQGFVHLRSFGWQSLQIQNAPTLQALVDGILDGAPFLMPEEI